LLPIPLAQQYQIHFALYGSKTNRNARQEDDFFWTLKRIRRYSNIFPAPSL
jgi:hypothetical protein